MRKKLKYFVFAFIGIILLGLMISMSTLQLPSLPSEDVNDTPVEDTTVKTTYYPVSTVLDNVVLTSYSSLRVSDNADTISLVFTAAEGYSLPDNITVTGCDYMWDEVNGLLFLANGKGNVTVTISAVEDETPDVGGGGSTEEPDEPEEPVEPTYYKITNNLTRVTADAANATQFSSADTYLELRFTANKGYSLPYDVTVTGCSYLWNSAVGLLTLGAPTGDITIEIIAKEIKYSISEVLTGVVASSSNSGHIYGSMAHMNMFYYYTAAEGYELPDTVTVTGADHTWSKSSGKLTITNVTGNVTISIKGVPVSTAIGTYVFNENFNEDELLEFGEYPNYISYDVKFECDGKEYAHIFIWNDGDEGTSITYMPEGYNINDTSDWLYASTTWQSSGNVWLEDSYRTITLLEEPSEEFLEFLSLYATKQP